MALVMFLLSIILMVMHGFLAFANADDTLVFTLNVIAACVWAVNIPLWAINAVDDM